VSCDPLLDQALLLLVQCQLLGALMEILFSASPEVGAKTTMGLGRHLPSNSFVRIDVEQDAPALGGQIAALRRRCGMHQSALNAIAHERLRELCAELALRLATFRANCRALLVVRALKLVVPCGFPVQVFKGRRAIVRGWRVRPNHALLAVALIPRPKLEPCDALVVHGDEM